MKLRTWLAAGAVALVAVGGLGPVLITLAVRGDA
jgi:hypothetical protein